MHAPRSGMITLMSVECLPWWPSAMANLRGRLEAHGEAATAAADAYAERYRGRRAAMVFDVVASRQRRYERTVLPKVEAFAATPAAASLAVLAQYGPGQGWGLRPGE